MGTLQCIEEVTMFQNLEIRNFRLFDHLKVERLGQINLVGGGNNSGKTTLLEALFLLCGTANPQLVLSINALRGFNNLVTPTTAIRETLLKPLFYQFASNQTIEINGQHDSLDYMGLKITVERKSTVAVPLKDRQTDTSTMDALDSIQILSSTLLDNKENVDFNDLHLDYVHRSRGIKSEGHLHIDSNGIQMTMPSNESPFLAIFVSSLGGNPIEDATRLGNLRRRKQGELLVDALKIMEPRLQTLEENSGAGYPMIWGDIGLPELVPLPMMGEGMNRIARILLAISTAAGGVVMMDEIENGIHYSVLQKVWSAIADAAERAQVQVFATTHSFECMAAAHQALGDKLMVHRIEQDKEGKNHCVTLEEEGIAAAVRHGFEVR